MDEQRCLELLLYGQGETTRKAWPEQLKNRLLWNACDQSVATDDSGRLQRWDEALTSAGCCIEENQLKAGRSLIRCASSAITAKAYLFSDQIFDVFLTLADLVDCTSDRITDDEILRTKLGMTDFDKLDPRFFIALIDASFQLLATKLTNAHEQLRRLSWTWDTIRTFIRVKRPILRSLEVPVVGMHNNACIPGTLVLELLGPGLGQVFHNPQDVLHTDIDPDFCKSMRAAWRAALALVVSATKSKDLGSYDGRWRLLTQEQSPIGHAHGASAGGAAAWGWYFAFTNRIADEGIVVMTQIEDSGQLNGVEAVPEKTKTCLGKFNKLDTIIIADENNEEQAREALEEGQKDNLVQLVRAGRIQDLVDVRSKLAKDLIGYCETLDKHLDEVPWLRDGKELKASEIQVPVHVALKPGLGYEEDRHDSSKTKGQQATNFMLNGFDTKVEEGVVEVQEWDEICQPPYDDKLLVIRAEPGGGKTFVSKTSVVHQAATLAHRLRAQVAALHSEAIPVYLEAKTLVAGGEVTNEGAIVDALKSQFEQIRNSTRLQEFIRSSLPERAWLFIDGLDELTSSKEIAYISKLLRTIHDWQGFRCVSCRATESIMWVPNRAREYRLTGFRWKEGKSKDNDIRLFINKWYNRNPERTDPLLDILSTNSSIRNLCRSPLLLTLSCLAHTEGSISENTTRCQLFESVLANLLSAKWRNIPIDPEIEERAYPVATEDGRLTFALGVLPHVAWVLFQALERPKQLHDGLAHNQFRGTEIIKAIESAPRWLNGDLSPDAFLEVMKHRGILLKAGKLTGIPCYSFLHRTFLEFLVAQHLVVDLYPNADELVSFVKSRIDFGNDHSLALWLPILPSIAGLLGDPAPLITELVSMIESEHNAERLASLTSILTSCLLECQAPLATENLLATAVEKVFFRIAIHQGRILERGTWHTLTNPDEIFFILGLIERHYGDEGLASVVSEITDELWRYHGEVTDDRKKEITAQLTQAKHSPAAPVRWLALKGLVALHAIEASEITRFLQDPDPSSVVRALAAEALAQVAKDSAFDTLQKILLSDSDDTARTGVMKALGRLGDSRVTPLLQHHALMKNEASAPVRGAAMYDLAQRARLDSKYLTEVFCEGLQDSMAYVQTSAMVGLGKLKHREMWPKLVQKLEANGSPVVRRTAADTLGQLAVEDAIPALFKGMMDADDTVASKCWLALSRYALDTARPQVEAFLANSDEWQKYRFISALQQSTWENRFSATLKPKHNEHVALISLSLLVEGKPSIKVAALQTLQNLIMFHKLPSQRTNDLLYQMHDVAKTLLKHEDALVRQKARYLLVHLWQLDVVDKVYGLTDATTEEEPVVVDTYLTFLTGGSNTAICARACRFFGRIPDQRAIKPCLELLQHSMEHPGGEFKRLRYDACNTLRVLRSHEAVDLCLLLLEDKAAVVRAAACLFFQEIPSNEAADPCLNLLIDHDPRVRASACHTLLCLREVRAAEPCLKLLEDQDPVVRSAACVFFRVIRHEKATNLCLELLTNDADSTVRASACGFFQVIRDHRAVEPCLQLLHNAIDPTLLASVCSVFQAMPDKRAAAQCLELLKHPDPRVRASACIALEKMKELRAIEPCMNLIIHDPDPRVRASACITLAQLARREVPKVKRLPLVNALEAALEDSDNGVRGNATIALNLLH